MPLFLLFIIFVTLNIQQWDTWELHWLIFDDAGGAGMWYILDEEEQLVNVCDVGGFIWEFKVSTDIDHFPPGTRTHAMHISGSYGPVSECPPA